MGESTPTCCCLARLVTPSFQPTSRPRPSRSSRWQIARYPGLPARHPSLVAGVLYRDWSRGRDDVTIVAVRQHPA